MAIRRTSLIWFAGLHVAAGLTVVLFPFFRVGATAVFSVIPVCILHDWLHIYCPLCGGTRAVDAMLHFHFDDALRFHPVVVAVAGIAAVWYVLAWVRLFRGKTLFAPIPKPLSVAVSVALIGFWIVRNVLLIGFGVDPVGDLVGFWH